MKSRQRVQSSSIGRKGQKQSCWNLSLEKYLQFCLLCHKSCSAEFKSMGVRISKTIAGRTDCWPRWIDSVSLVGLLRRSQESSVFSKLSPFFPTRSLEAPDFDFGNSVSPKFVEYYSEKVWFKRCYIIYFLAALAAGFLLLELPSLVQPSWKDLVLDKLKFMGHHGLDWFCFPDFALSDKLEFMGHHGLDWFCFPCWTSKTFSGVVSILQVVSILSDALVRGAGFWFWRVWGTDAK